MAALQRKLVHKQFNSPMGLYSQENVKATLNRELKAFGADGIEIDEQITKPLNLANSAVLRAVEEEEQQVKCGDYLPHSTQRQSRSRQRDGDPAEVPHHALHQQLLDQIKTQFLSHQHDVVIDRDTVLRINRMSTRRHLLKRDHSWPPVEPEAEVAVVHATITPSPTHSFEVLREKFNSPTRIVELTSRELRDQRLQLQGSTNRKPQQAQHQPSPRTPSKIENTSINVKVQDNLLTPQAKGFSAPETKAADADIGLVAPKREYYEQLTQKRPSTPTLRSSTPYRPRLKRQSYSLDRGRARKRGVAMSGATELPPPKPRNGSGSGSGSGSGTPKVQRRSIKLATELKICYDTDTANDGDSEEEPKGNANLNPSGDIDLETVPLPAPPSGSSEKAATAAANLMTKTSGSLPRKVSTVIDNLALKQQQQMALALATASAPSVEAQLQLGDRGRIIPVAVSVETSAAGHPGQLEARVQQIYDDACNYLRQDQRATGNMSPPTNTDDATVPATYVSATSGIKLQRQESATRYNRQSSTIGSSCIPTPPPLPPPPAPPFRLRGKSKDSTEEKTLRRQGVIYSSKPETPPTLAAQHEAHLEIAQLEAKYAHIQQSITEHLRQIDTYMENAKTALQRSVQATPTPPPEPPKPPKPPTTPVAHNPNELWDMFASRQSPILAVESPLQAILRQIYCRAAGIQLQAKEQETPVASMEPVLPAENVPIVERALEDLHKIAVALDNDEHALLLHVEHKTTPTAVKAEHVVIDEEELEELQQATTLHVQDEDKDFSLDYRHVSDVIANYEQLSTGKETVTKSHDLQLCTDKENSVKSQELQLGQGMDESSNQEEHIKEKATQADKTNKERELWNEKEEKEKELLKEMEQQLEKEREHKEQEQKKDRELMEKAQQEPKDEQEAAETTSCTHEPADDSLGSWCAVCGECRDSPHGWGKLNKADQWRFDNLKNEPLANYKSTYEIRSPYVSRQISWEDTQQSQQQQQQQPKEQLQRQRSVVEIVTTPATAPATPVAPAAPAAPAATASPATIAATPDTPATAPTPPLPLSTDAKEWQLSRSPSPLPSRKYPAPLFDTAQRCSSPFGLNAVQARATPTPTAVEAKYTHVSQLEGHNIGLLVHTATEPLQLCMSASSSLLAATPPATPRCNSQPPPFDFLVQHGLGPQAEFQSIAASEELTQSTREFSINRSFDNVSPRPYIGIEGACKSMCSNCDSLWHYPPHLMLCPPSCVLNATNVKCEVDSAYL